VSKIWEYIRSHNLQNPENRREIVADDQLRRVFGKDKVTMFEINKCLAAHLTWSGCLGSRLAVIVDASGVDVGLVVERVGARIQE
jgi:SWIB/MDM2 domain-containing protein